MDENQTNWKSYSIEWAVDSLIRQMNFILPADSVLPSSEWYWLSLGGQTMILRCQVVHAIAIWHRYTAIEQRDFSQKLAFTLVQGRSVSYIKQESCAIAKMTVRCVDKSKQTATPPPKITWLLVHSIQPDVMDDRCWPNIFSPKFLHVPLGVGGWLLGYKGLEANP